jgi:hypothetical protein
MAAAAGAPRPGAGDASGETWIRRTLYTFPSAYRRLAPGGLRRFIL